MGSQNAVLWPFFNSIWRARDPTVVPPDFSITATVIKTLHHGTALQALEIWANS